MKMALVKTIARKSINLLPYTPADLCKGSKATQNTSEVMNTVREITRQIIIKLPVPAGTNYTVISCYMPPEVTRGQLNRARCGQKPQYLSSCCIAWGVDIEDNANRERSDSHWNKAIQLLQFI